MDVLVIDEAGQLSLADALAACRSADNLLLLGDPLQLPQVAQASHPAGSGRSALEHVLGESATMPPEWGVFLSESRRMHPDVCGFVSQHVYEGRLTSHPSCAQQSTERGTGLRWLRAEHTGRSTNSEEEAELVRNEILRLLGTPWIDQHGVTNPLEVEDVLVVAPYNDQVDLLRRLLDAEPRTRGIAVGTVDKFQAERRQWSCSAWPRPALVTCAAPRTSCSRGTASTSPSAALGASRTWSAPSRCWTAEGATSRRCA